MMRCKGVCFFADVPNAEAPHYIVIASDINADDEMLVIPISSIKFQENGRYSYNGQACKYYDDACTFDVGEITADDGRGVIIKPSFARYEWAKAVKQSDVVKKQLAQSFRYKCTVSDEILRRIQNGAKTSKELPPIFRKFFEVF